jgi:hypothetical protein
VQSLELEPPLLVSRRAPDSAEQRTLWQAMSVCRPDQVPLNLAAAIAGVPDDRALKACDGLIEQRLIDPLDAKAATYGLNETAFSHGGDHDLRRRHAQCVMRLLDSSFAEAESGLNWACEADWSLGLSIGKQLFTRLQSQGREDESTLVLQKLEAKAEECGDLATLEYVRNELSWISGSPWRHAAAAGIEQLHLDLDV